jgi:chemotaxis protein histidine kinase CheA
LNSGGLFGSMLLLKEFAKNVPHNGAIQWVGAATINPLFVPGVSVFATADGVTRISVRDKGGTGLGLSIVKQMVTRLGGQVGFDDAEAGGTVLRPSLVRE